MSLCEGHSENGRKAGHQWNTANRPKLRRYLWRYYGLDCQMHGCEMKATTVRDGRRFCEPCAGLIDGGFA